MQFRIKHITCYSIAQRIGKAINMYSKVFHAANTQNFPTTANKKARLKHCAWGGLRATLFFVDNLLYILQSSVAVFIGLVLHGDFLFDVLKVLADALNVCMKSLQEIRYHRDQTRDNVQLKFVHG